MTRSDETDDTARHTVADHRRGVLARLRERGVIRVAAGYSVIAWLLLQIADVTFEPLGVPRWVMISLIVGAVLGFPVAIALAWHLKLSDCRLEGDSVADAAVRPAIHGLRRYADVAIIGVLLGAVSILFVRQSDIGRPPPPARPTIAVLPFENLSGDPEQEYFSDGLAEEMLDRLGRVPGLTVMARSSSFSFKGKGLDARTIAERLGVTTVLEGSVQRDGRRLRLTARLIDGATGRQAWSGSFDRELTDILIVQAELAAAVVAAVVPASRGEIAVAAVLPTSDLQAHDLYLLGRAAMESRVEINDAVRYFEAAVQANPNHVNAHAALSRALVLWAFYQWVPAPPDALRRAEASAYRALAIDPRSSEAHAALGTVFRSVGNSAGAADEYSRALELNPNNAVALWDFIVLLNDNPAAEDQVATLMERYGRLDPRSAILWQSRVFDASEGGSEVAVHEVVDDAIAMLADDVNGLRLVALAARRTGYAPEAYRVSLAIARAGNAQLATSLAVRTWLLVDDLERARRAAEALGRMDDATARKVASYLLGEIAGLSGEFEAWARYAGVDLQSNDINCIPEAAFWLAVQQRYREAAERLGGCDPVPESAVGGLGAGLVGQSQLLPAMLRIYRATGRGGEADVLAQEYFTKLRQDENPFSRLDLAALAANEGLQDEAVTTLTDLFRQYPLVDFFFPQLPWFRSLENHSGYDQLMAERTRRIARAHAEMLQLEASAGGSVPQLR